MSKANLTLQILLPVARCVHLIGMITIAIEGIASIASSPLLEIHSFKTSRRATLTILLFVVPVMSALLLSMLSAALLIHKPRHFPYID